MANKYRLLGGQHREGKTVYKGPFQGAKGDIIVSESDLCGRFPNKFELIETNVAMPAATKAVVDATDDGVVDGVAVLPAPKAKAPKKVVPESDESLLTEDDVTDHFPDAATNGYVVVRVDAPHAKGGGYFIRKVGSDENLAGGAKTKAQVEPTLEKLILGDI